MRSYLAVVAGVISEADYVFIPESPPPVDWEAKLCTKLEQARIFSVLGDNEECDLKPYSYSVEHISY